MCSNECMVRFQQAIDNNRFSKSLISRKTMQFLENWNISSDAKWHTKCYDGVSTEGTRFLEIIETMERPDIPFKACTNNAICIMRFFRTIILKPMRQFTNGCVQLIASCGRAFTNYLTPAGVMGVYDWCVAKPNLQIRIKAYAELLKTQS